MFCFKLLPKNIILCMTVAKRLNKIVSISKTKWKNDSIKYILYEC